MIRVALDMIHHRFPSAIPIQSLILWTTNDFPFDIMAMRVILKNGVWASLIFLAAFSSLFVSQRWACCFIRISRIYWTRKERRPVFPDACIECSNV